MKRVVTSITLASVILLMAAALSGCLSVNPDDSDQPWNVPSPNEGVPNMPGMQQ
jgi:hypothetical protein